jgi:hypothetical protein
MQPELHACPRPSACYWTWQDVGRSRPQCACTPILCHRFGPARGPAKSDCQRTTAASDIANLAALLPAPRLVMLYIPAGPPVESVLQELAVTTRPLGVNSPRRPWTRSCPFGLERTFVLQQRMTALGHKPTNAAPRAKSPLPPKRTFTATSGRSADCQKRLAHYNPSGSPAERQASASGPKTVGSIPIVTAYLSIVNVGSRVITC